MKSKPLVQNQTVFMQNTNEKRYSKAKRKRINTCFLTDI